jgi:hypothetical protein
VGTYQHISTLNAELRDQNLKIKPFKILPKKYNLPGNWKTLKKKKVVKFDLNPAIEQKF